MPRNLLRITLPVLLTALPLLTGCPPDGGTRPPIADAPTWSADLAGHAATVRANHRYYIQGIFVAQPTANTALVLVTEPPRTITAVQLAAALGSEYEQEFVHPVGADGWVKDIGFVVHHEGDIDLADRLARVAQQLYGTSYGFVPLASNKPAPSNDLSVELGYATVSSVLEAEAYVQDGHSLTIDRLIAVGRPGLAVGDQTAALRIPHGADLCDLQVELRKFAVETDLVLGAAFGPEATVLVGRQRRVPANLLPPLRVETMLDLAAPEIKEVGQSFERSTIPAGMVPGSSEAWAPIYLSDNVIDNEFGGILNITDQMLKSWSLGGRVKYRNFSDEPPSPIPFGGELPSLLGTSSIVFNWNTRVASTVAVDTDGFGVLAVSRAGSLPMQYNPGTGGATAAKYEAVAYDYFAGLNDPMLARVVQYTAINQALQISEVRASCVGQRSFDTAAVLERHVEGALLAVREGNYDIAAALQRFKSEGGEALVGEIGKAMTALGFDASAYSDDAKLTLLIVAAALDLNELLVSLSIEEVRELAAVVANRNRVQPTSAAVVAVADHLTNDPLSAWVIRLSMDIDAVIREYEQYNSSTSHSWIKTPRSVYSTIADSDWVGGHNISPVPKRLIIVDRSVRRNQIEYDPRNPVVVRVNPRDIGKIDAITEHLSADDFSAVARDAEKKLASASVAPQPISKSTAAPNRADLLPHKANAALSAAPGWLDGQTKLNLSPELGAALDASAKAGRVAIHVDIVDSAYHATIVQREGQRLHIESGSTEALIEVVHDRLGANGKGIDIYFGDNFEDVHASAMHRTLELRQAGHVSMRGQGLAGAAARAIIEADPTLDADGITTATRLGAHEAQFRIGLDADTASYKLEINVRSANNFSPTALLQRLLPPSSKQKSIGQFVDELEVRAQQEGVTIDLDVIFDLTSVEVGTERTTSARI